MQLHVFADLALNTSICDPADSKSDVSHLMTSVTPCEPLKYALGEYAGITSHGEHSGFIVIHLGLQFRERLEQRTS